MAVPAGVLLHEMTVPATSEATPGTGDGGVNDVNVVDTSVQETVAVETLRSTLAPITLAQLLHVPTLMSA